MNASGDGATLAGPTADQAAQALRAARRMFERTLASWASDLLLLRQAGLVQPCWREAAMNLPLNQAA